MTEEEFNKNLQKYLNKLTSLINNPGKAQSLAREFEDEFKIGYKLFSFCDGLRGDFAYYSNDKIVDKTKDERWITSTVMPSQIEVNKANDKKWDLKLHLNNCEIIFYKEEKDYFATQDYSNPYSTTPVTRLIEVYKGEVLVFNPKFHYEWLPSAYGKPYFSVFKPSEWLFYVLLLSTTYMNEKAALKKKQELNNTINNLLP